MISRVRFVSGIGAALLLPLAAEAQTAKVHLIGWIASVAPAVSPVQAFREGLRQLGYVEGQNISIEYRWAEGKFDRLPALAAELVRLRVDVIVAASTPAIQAIQQATQTIPVVMAVSGDPVESGFVANLARPGGNITGMSSLGPEIVGKQLELLRQAVPTATRVAVLWNPASPIGPPQLREAERAAQILGIRLQVVSARSANDFEGAFAAFTRERAGALLVVGDAMFLVHRARLAELAATHRLPGMYGLREHAEAGALMAYAANLADLFRRAATYVDKILKGARPGELPIEQPTKFDLVINLKTARALGLTIPQSLLLRADQVFE